MTENSQKQAMERNFFVKLRNGHKIQFNIFDLPRLRLLNKRNVIMVFTGDPGSGKSYSGLFTAQYLSPDFQAENVVFGFRPFLQRFKDCKKGEWIVYEEAGAEFGARDAMTKGNKNFSRILQVYRFKQVPTIFNLPDLNMLDVNGRRMMNYHIKSEKIDFRKKEGIGKWYVIKPNDWDDEPKRYKIRVLDTITGELAVIEEVRFPMATRKLLDEYEKMKKEYFDKLYDSILKEPKEKEKKEKPVPAGEMRYVPDLFKSPDPREMEASAEQNLFLGLLKKR